MSFVMKFVLYCLIFVGLYLPVEGQDYATDYTVTKDESGDFTSIQDAVDATKAFPDQPITIYIKNGVYREKVRVPQWNTNLSFIGENKDSTIIVYNDHFKAINRGPNSTFYTATLKIEADDFHAENLTIRNDAGPVGQAIALHVEGDRVSFLKVRIMAHQDALYLAGNGTRQYFKNCEISGTTDFIFGEATVLFEKCDIIAKANSFITAASTPEDKKYGFVFKNCRIEAEQGVKSVYLGRPWRPYAKTAFIDCSMGGFIRPEGWDNWRNLDNEMTTDYVEYNTTGAGANPKHRVSWSRQLSGKEKLEYNKKNIFSREADSWSP